MASQWTDRLRTRAVQAAVSGDEYVTYGRLYRPDEPREDRPDAMEVLRIVGLAGDEFKQAVALSSPNTQKAIMSTLDDELAFRNRIIARMRDLKNEVSGRRRYAATQYEKAMLTNEYISYDGEHATQASDKQQYALTMLAGPI